ncbi:RidA family protein [Compostimonas suwonensis]|uniref:Enamine deaminase RidA (YjgF/YER057c/UK114 family) n=1 Tax=Compostimonas suwonensis TaxID=1048394 RepID=A0A2M9C073_9MICO|nr:RidA family protein [Compostimonas suwonensis]PJJ63737.1 enamine deaminase RidA (YjgF/YER057c/UK114 family) [Compostimonas suwonensis]
MSAIDERLAELGLQLPKPRTSTIANLVKTVRTGDLLFVSGHGPRDVDGEVVHTGKLGAELTVEEGYDAARLCVLGCLTSAKEALGSLDRVTRVVKALGYIASDPGFYQQPHVMNGASDVLVDVFGEKGRHSRAAIGVAVIPHNMAMEVELVLEVD